MNAYDLAATTISRARHTTEHDYGWRNAGFDYRIATGSLTGRNARDDSAIAVRELRNAAYDLAGEIGVEPDALWAQIMPELEAYQARCKERKYRGWSTSNTRMIRYA